MGKVLFVPESSIDFLDNFKQRCVENDIVIVKIPNADGTGEIGMCKAVASFMADQYEEILKVHDVFGVLSSVNPLAFWKREPIVRTVQQALKDKGIRAPIVNIEQIKQM